MKEIILAVPKGRILQEVLPLIEKSDIIPEEDFYNDDSRKLIFDSNHKNLKIIKIRSFDVATFVAFGAAHIGICGSDVLQEFSYDNIYSLADLEIGKCRLSIAAPEKYKEDEKFWNSSHLRIATKYVNLTKKYFEDKGIQAECIKLNGSIELAPKLNLCRRIVDLVSTGNTLKANGMVEGSVIMDISSRLIANKQAFKAYKSELSLITDKIKKSV